MGSLALRCLRGLAEARAETEKARTAEDEEEADEVAAVRKDEPRPGVNDIAIAVLRQSRTSPS